MAPESGIALLEYRLDQQDKRLDQIISKLDLIEKERKEDMAQREVEQKRILVYGFRVLLMALGAAITFIWAARWSFLGLPPSN